MSLFPAYVLFLDLSAFESLDVAFERLDTALSKAKADPQSAANVSGRKSEGVVNVAAVTLRPGANPKLVVPSAEEWRLLLKGSATRTFAAGDAIVKRGPEVEQLLQLVVGAALSKRGEKIAPALAGGYFALSAFVLGREVASSVVAQCECKVNLLEGFYLNILFSHYPALLPKFFAWVALELAAALKSRSIA